MLSEKELENINATTWEDLNPDWAEDGDLTDRFNKSQFDGCPGCDQIEGIGVYVATEDLEVAVACRPCGWQVFADCPSAAIEKWNARANPDTVPDDVFVSPVIKSVPVMLNVTVGGKIERLPIDDNDTVPDSPWTAVSEKSPPYDGEYLCIVRLPQECGLVWYRRRVEYCENNSFDEKVIAWMKMPEVPKFAGRVFGASPYAPTDSEIEVSE